MASIYSFLQKRKLHENQHGIIMVITAYVLSIIMLVLGSDVFYNINSAAAGIKTEALEETKDLNPTETLDKNGPEYTAAPLQAAQIINPYGLTAEQGNELVQTVTKGKGATADTVWFLGSAMDYAAFDNLMVSMESIVDLKDTALTGNSVQEAADTSEAATEVKAAITGNKTEKAGQANAKADEKASEVTTYSVKVASADKVITVTKKEVGMLERIVEAEASGEDMIGKILVVNVIFNRIVDGEFPDNVEDVILQHDHGDYQFSPVKSGKFWDVKPSKETKKAVQRALEGEDYSEGALYFVAKKKTTKKSANWFDNSLEWLFKHGGHDFYKG